MHSKSVLSMILIQNSLRISLEVFMATSLVCYISFIIVANFLSGSGNITPNRIFPGLRSCHSFQRIGIV